MRGLIVDRTHPVLDRGKLVLQKRIRVEFPAFNYPKCVVSFFSEVRFEPSTLTFSFLRRTSDAFLIDALFVGALAVVVDDALVVAVVVPTHLILGAVVAIGAQHDGQLHLQNKPSN